MDHSSTEVDPGEGGQVKPCDKFPVPMRFKMTTQIAPTSRIFIGCFEFINQENFEEGSFQIAIAASDAKDAATRCRARLDEIADSSDNFGPVDVYLNALVELGSEALARGTYLNLKKVDSGGDASFRDTLPEQGSAGSTVHHWETINREMAKIPSNGKRDDIPIFWTGVDDFNKKLKLYWCETYDHDEDWFVIARDEDEAVQFFADYEGYDEDEAIATLVCVLPASEQRRRKGASWPENDTLIACGGEFLPLVTHDGAESIRRRVGAGSRAVRLKGTVYAEGDIVGNVMNRMGLAEES